MKRYRIERLSRTSLATWRMVLGTNSLELAQARFASLAAGLRRGNSLRIVDTTTWETLARAHRPVQDAPARST